MTFFKFTSFIIMLLQGLSLSHPPPPNKNAIQSTELKKLLLELDNLSYYYIQLSHYIQLNLGIQTIKYFKAS